MGSYFLNKRGLRQGDQSSPLIFNFVADALAAMINKARAAGHIKGLVTHLIPGGELVRISLAAEDINLPLQGLTLLATFP